MVITSSSDMLRVEPNEVNLHLHYEWSFMSDEDSEPGNLVNVYAIKLLKGYGIGIQEKKTDADGLELLVGISFRQYAGQNVGYQNGYNAVQNVGNQVVQDAVQNQNGQIGVQNIGNGNVVAARAEEDWVILLGTAQSDQGEGMLLIFRLTDLDEIEEIFNMFTQEEQYTEILEPIPEPHQVQQNDNVISDISGVEQEGGTVDQHTALLSKLSETLVCLYHGKVLLEKHVPTVVNDSEETRQLAQESRQKVKSSWARDACTSLHSHSESLNDFCFISHGVHSRSIGFLISEFVDIEKVAVAPAFRFPIYQSCSY
ncbi:hypothetical protein Tco_0548592 [Tanacetum coccineum]